MVDTHLDGTDQGSRFPVETQALLDRAAGYEHHEGAMAFNELKPGEFWSITVENCFKSFGSNAVMKGLTLGIPEGMITVVLGPSGTGKSVLLKHLIGSMFPDMGDIRVHGESVTDMRLSELLEMRKRFGILFQDGTLFGSKQVTGSRCSARRTLSSASSSAGSARAHSGWSSR
jgi:phospholipid/cholesterol/gamma-HCH transport system ATP-binding protein